VTRALQILKRILAIAVALLAIVYAGEDISVRYRIPGSRDPYGTVSVRRYYAVIQKNGKPDFYFDEPTDQVCVRSLFPHLGIAPCWYLSRHKMQRVDM
jgi:hypothetical protein